MNNELPEPAVRGEDTESAKTSLVDLLSKTVALIIACIYGFGFLVVSLNEAGYGILQFSALKPRIFSTGSLFFLMLAIPTFAVRRVLRRSLVSESTAPSWLKWSFDRNRYFNMCVLLALVSFEILWGMPDSFKGLSLPRLVAIPLYIFLSLYLTRRFFRHYQTEPEKSSLLPLADFVLMNVAVLYIFHGFAVLIRLVYWLFFVGLYAAWLDDRLRDSKKRERLYVELLLIYLLVLVTSYARFMYPNLNPSIGGGRLPIVTVYLTQKVSPFDQLQESVYLVDENESGFYFVQNPTDRRAVFVPRSSVASLQFENRLAPVVSR